MKRNAFDFRRMGFAVCLCAFVFSLTLTLESYDEYREGDRLYEETVLEFVTIEPETDGEEMPADPAELPPEPGGDLGRPAEGETEFSGPDEKNPPGGTAAPKPAGPAKPEPRISVDFAKLKSVNEDIISWIYIPKTVVNYPVLRGIDNQKYLYTTYNGKTSKFGSIFIDMYNADSFSDAHTIIYGHNLGNGSMFGALSGYMRQAYYKAHPYIYLMLDGGGYLKYEVFSAYTTEVDDGVFIRRFQTEEQHKEYLEMITASSWVQTPAAPGTGDKVITLATCTTSSRKEQRFVVHAVLIEDSRKAEQEKTQEAAQQAGAQNSENTAGQPDVKPPTF